MSARRSVLSQELDFLDPRRTVGCRLLLYARLLRSGLHVLIVLLSSPLLPTTPRRPLHAAPPRFLQPRAGGHGPRASSSAHAWTRCCRPLRPRHPRGRRTVRLEHGSRLQRSAGLSVTPDPGLPACSGPGRRASAPTSESRRC